LDDKYRAVLDGKIQKLKNESMIKDSTLCEYFYLVSEIPKGEGEVDMEFVRKCIDRVDWNGKNKYGDTALHELCKLSNERNNCVLLAKLLVENGANKLEKNNFGQSALHLAAANDNVDLINYLLESSVNGQAEDLIEMGTNKENQTALHYAARNGSMRAIFCLLKKYKANIEASDYLGLINLSYRYSSIFEL
jgi:ankyrin repeat protein